LVPFIRLFGRQPPALGQGSEFGLVGILDYAIESARQTAYELYQNQNMTPIFYPKPTHEDKVSARNYMYNIIISNPQLYSIYIFVDGHIVLTVGGSTFVQDSDEELLALLRNNERLSPIPRRVVSKNGSENLITTFYNENESTYVIINYLLVHNRSYILFFMGDHNSFFEKILKTRNTIVLFCSVILLFLLVISFLISYRVYSPIHNVFSNLRSLLGNDNCDPDVTRDLKNISGAISNVVERLNNFERDSYNNFMQKLLHSQSLPSESEFEKGMQKCGVPMKPSCSYQVLVLRVDRYKKMFEANNTKESMSFQLNSVESIACETLKPICACTGFLIDMEHVILLAVRKEGAAAEKDGAGMAHAPVELCRKVQGTVSQLFNLQMTIGISSLSPSLGAEALKSMYQEAYCVTNYRLMQGGGQIYVFGEASPDTGKKDRTGALVDSVVSSVKSGSAEQFQNTFDLLLNTLQSYPYEKIIGVLFHLAEAISRIPSELQPNHANSLALDVEQTYGRLKSMEDFDEITIWFTDLFVKANELISGLKSKKAVDLFNAALKYINEYYPDSTLSASLISDKLGITPQYFSRLFRQFTGANFPDYINNIRLEKAKELLLSNPLLNISEICSRTGYNSTSYFATSFAKKFGIPPSKYALTAKAQAYDLAPALRYFSVFSITRLLTVTLI
jgi:AraC-like DNA-binding protein